MIYSGDIYAASFKVFMDISLPNIVHFVFNLNKLYCIFMVKWTNIIRNGSSSCQDT